MIISMKRGASREQIDHVRDRIIAFGYKVHSIEGEERVVIGAVGVGDTTPAIEQLESTPGVESVTPISQPFKVVSRQMQPAKTVIRINGFSIGGDNFGIDAPGAALQNSKLTQDYRYLLLSLRAEAGCVLLNRT